jgi:hypothetical protein
MGEQLKLAAAIVFGISFVTLGNPVSAADLVVPHAAVRAPYGAAAYPYPGWYGNWSRETGLPITSYVDPPYAGPYGYPYLPAGYNVMHYQAASPYCGWVTRRGNGYGGRVVIWPVEGCR